MVLQHSTVKKSLLLIHGHFNFYALVCLVIAQCAMTKKLNKLINHVLLCAIHVWLLYRGDWVHCMKEKKNLMEDQRGAKDPHSLEPQRAIPLVSCCCSITLWLYNASFCLRLNCECRKAVSELVYVDLNFKDSVSI